MFKIPQHQVAGHQADGGKLGPLVDNSGRFYKPLQSDHRGTNEVAFYKSLSTQSGSIIPENILRFFPVYHGTEQVDATDGSGLKPHLVLQDLNAGYKLPSIVDIKIGTRTWYPQASETYVTKCLRKDRESSTVELGFRLCGLQVYNSKESGYWKPDRKAVAKLSGEDVKLVLRKFVSDDGFDSIPDCSVAGVLGGSNGIISQLMELKAWFEDQTMFHFYSCSVLLMYDKEKALNGGDGVAEVKMIDFAHVVEGNHYWRKEQLQRGPNSGNPLQTRCEEALAMDLQRKSPVTSASSLTLAVANFATGLQRNFNDIYYVFYPVQTGHFVATSLQARGKIFSQPVTTFLQNRCNIQMSSLQIRQQIFEYRCKPI